MNFENLEVWKRSARLSADIYKATAELKDFGFGINLRDQVYLFQVILLKV